MLNAGSFAYLRYIKSITAPMVFYWQFGLLMQIPEGLAWTQIGSAHDISAASRATMLLNVLQPLALLGAVWCGRRRRSYVAAVAVFMYALLLLAEAPSIWDSSETIAPKERCFHLNLGYWNGSRTTLYVFASLIAFSAIPAIVWAIVNAAIFIITLLIAVVAYPCGGGSMWCWMICVAGLILCGFDVWIRLVFSRNALAILSAPSVRCNVFAASANHMRRLCSL